MDLLEQPEIKKTYNESKYKVKYWEHQFKKKNGRLPSKLDIKEADREIRYAYKTYFNLKTAALEESFKGVDGFNSDEDDYASASTNNITETDLALLQDDTCDTTAVSEESSIVNNESEVQNTEKTWGEHLNIQNIPVKTKKADKIDINSSFTSKLFKNSSFSKRNPRKSLSFQHRKSDNNLSNSSYSKSFSQPLEESSCNGSIIEELNNSQSSNISFKTINCDNIKITSNVNAISQASVNVADMLLRDNFTKERKIDSGWLNRVVNNVGPVLNEKLNDNIDISLSTNVVQQKATVNYDSDEVIGDSDEEDTAKFHPTKRFKPNESTRIKNIETTTQRLDFSNLFTNALSNSLELPKIEKPVPKEVISENKIDDVRAKEVIDENKIEKVQPATRKSGRNRKVLVNIQSDNESEDKADPFANSGDEDPDFSCNEEKTNKSAKTKEKSPKIPKKSPKVAKKSPKDTKKPKSKKNTTKEKSEEDKDENEAEQKYELEYSVKPRFKTVPRTEIKKIVKSRVKKQTQQEDVAESNDETLNPKLKRLQEKLASGKANENFVKIDIQKKVFVRGKKNMNFTKYKKKMWKQLKKNNALCGPNMDMGGCDGGKLTCFNCGEEGHFAQKCPKNKVDNLLPIEVFDENECPFPTLEEASKMAKESELCVRVPTKLKSGQNEEDASDSESDSGDPFSDCDIDDDELLREAARLEKTIQTIDMPQFIDAKKTVPSYYQLSEDGNVIDTPREVYEALRSFGHISFRPGQEEAIMRILSGKSTLLTLSTGSGKSLCYQLPALLYARKEKSIVLVISPLVSLMEDQVTGIPAILKAACLHTYKTKIQRDKILEALGSGNLDVLLISPEAIVAGEKQMGFGSLLRQLPPISFACIDEVHCVSQWSDNFRPSYLMLCRILKERLGVNTILGLTATATRATMDSVINHVGIPDGRSGVITDKPLPDNLKLTVSKDGNRDYALLGLLLSERFANLKSIIIYCIRRQECERIASFLRTSLKTERPPETDNRKRKRLNVQAEPYHAGLSAGRRKSIQKSFMSGELRIVVATVAFGMGINKPDIRAVIHYNLPRNFESYVQEVGRAGRDGLPAHCHLFLDYEGRDANELQRHIFSDSVDRHVIRKLLQKIFIPCSCKSKCPKHEVAFSIQATVLALDIPEENISTLLCYLELHEKRYIEVLSPVYTMCKIFAYGSGNLIKKAAKDCPPLAMALVMFGDEEKDEKEFSFPIVEVAAAMGWDSGICKHKLKNLEWLTVNNQPKRSLLSVQFENLGFRLLAPGNLTGEELDETLDSLYKKVTDQERTSLLQLHALHNSVISAAAKSYQMCMKEENDVNEQELKKAIRNYFEDPNPLDCVKIKQNKVDQDLIVNDIRALMGVYRDTVFTGRSIARIFFGISSPNFPAVIWGRCKYWRAHINSDFNAICSLAKDEILRFRR